MSFAETAHLRIRGFRESDLDALVALVSAPEFIRGNRAAAVPLSEEKLRKDLADEPGDNLMLCILETKDGNEFVGLMTLKSGKATKNRNATFGIGLDAKFWGKGYGTEATRWIVNHAFEQLGLHRVSLSVLSDNPRAIALYKTVGFVEEGRERQANFQDGKWWDCVNMGILEPGPPQ